MFLTSSTTMASLRIHGISHIVDRNPKAKERKTIIPRAGPRFSWGNQSLGQRSWAHTSHSQGDSDPG